MREIANWIDKLNDKVGRAVSWLALAMVLVQLGIVLARYVFGTGSLWAQESLVYMHATLFMLLAGWTLKVDGHVRVDIFYREARPQTKALINLIGTLLLLLPFCIMVLIVSWPYVAQSWAIKEGSNETTGIPLIYLLKTEILIFAVLLFLQGISSTVTATLALRGDADALARFSTETE